MRFWLMIFLLLGISSPSYSGGTEWDVAVEEMRREGTNYTLNLKAVNDSQEQPMGCSTLVVHGEYARLRWLLNSDMTIEKHVQALDYLESLGKLGKTISLGSMGAGLEPLENQSCHFKSHGLALINSIDRTAVYSFCQTIASEVVRKLMISFGLGGLLVGVISIWIFSSLSKSRKSQS
jgi:hypothetical protein